MVSGTLVLAAAGFWLWRFQQGDSTRAAGSGSGRAFRLPEERQAQAEYAGSESCRECHSEAYYLWQASHHGLAERGVSAALDRAAFDPDRSFHHGSQVTLLGWSNGSARVTALGLFRSNEVFAVERVIGHYPLRQFLVPFPGGRLQTLEASYDPRSNEWFNVYGAEDRQPGEWGHWTGRGMNWNSMCAACHNTRVRKNYDEASDSYHTSMVELTVGCEACHGPLKRHNEWQLSHGKSGVTDPTITRATRQQVLDTCGFCHARRADLTGDFKPGDAFMDHLHPSVVDETTAYHPDGQVRDENYEFSAFLGSKMHQAGVYCLDCHNPHSAKTLLPGNFLCLRCHDGSRTNAPVIDPVRHSHHRVFGCDTNGVLASQDVASYDPRKIKETGGECINCHMPQTAYMQRHWRHDHGFTIPDPLLTKEHGIPNACNRCHADQSTDWSIQWTDRWYGEKMNRPTRERARWLARARAGDSSARDPLLKYLGQEPIPYWQASIIRLLASWAGEPKVYSALLARVDSTNALVRAEAINSLAPLLEGSGDSPLRSRMESGLLDPVRAVRVAAARALQDKVDLGHGAGSELLHSLNFNADHPSGQFQKGLLYLTRQDRRSLGHFLKAIEWDPYSPPFHSQYAAALSLFGDTAAAARHLVDASRLLPNSGDIQYQLALAANELGSPADATAHLENAVRLDPRHYRAWYNLGLARNAQGQPDAALEALTQAEALEPGNPDPAYARATILARLGRDPEALQALSRVLYLAPSHTEALQLQRRLKR